MNSEIQHTLFFLAELWVHCFHLQSETWCLIWICYRAEIGRTFFSQLFDYEFQKESHFPHIAEHSDLFKAIGPKHRRDLEHSEKMGMLYFYSGYQRIRRQSKAHLQQAKQMWKKPKNFNQLRLQPCGAWQENPCTQQVHPLMGVSVNHHILGLEKGQAALSTFRMIFISHKSIKRSTAIHKNPSVNITIHLHFQTKKSV